MASAAESALQEIVAALAAMAPQHEGLRDYARLNLKPETLQEVQRSITAHDERKAKLETARDTLETLIADGYPVLDPREVVEAVIEDLEENAATIEAALAQFRSGAAVGMSLIGSEPEDKA